MEMRFKTLFTVGTIFLIVSLPYSGLLIFFSTRAKLHDSFFSYKSLGPCSHPLSGVQLDRTVIAIKESVSLKVILSNDTSAECKAEVTVSAPKFEIIPSQQTKEINVPVGKDTANLVWVLTPKEEGLQAIGVQAGLDVETRGLSITNILGLTPKQAQIFSYVGTFFGGPITFAGLWSQWTKYQSERKKRKEEEEEEEELKAQESQKKSKKSVFSFINRLRGRS
jgi:hypothetical protein